MREDRAALHNYLMPRCSRIIELRKIVFRVEPGKQQQPREEAADVCLPGNRLVAASNRKRAEPEQQVDAKSGGEEKQHAGIAQHTAQWNRRNAVGAVIGTPQQSERSSALKNKPHGRRHRSGNRS